MISAQIDELRKLADGQASYRDARAAMLQAADTIWELRDDLQRANAENAKLRKDAAETALMLGAAWEYCSKLRELAEKAWKTAERLCQAFDGPCRDDGVTIAKPCPMGERDEECVYGQLQRDLRELGVEVDA